MPEIDGLNNIVGQEHVSDDHDNLSAYSMDESFVHPIMPVGVVKPGSVEEVQQVIRWGNETNTPLVPVSSGTPRFHGDTIPSTGGAVMVDMGRLNKVVRVDSRNRVVMIEPGVTFGELIPELEKEGLAPFLPLSPKSTKSVVASLLEREPITMPRYHWESQDPLRCLEVVYGTGDLFRTGSAIGPGTLEEQWAVGKAQSRPFGPSWFDFAKFVQGGQGTMGIVTWTTVACRPLPRIRNTYFVPSENLETLIDFTRKMLWKKLGQDLLILNRHNLACLIAEDQERILDLREQLPQWTALVSIEGFGLLPEDRADYQTAELMETAQSFGLSPATRLAKIRGEQISTMLSQPSEEPYWKLRYKGGCQDTFFLTTMDKAPNFIKAMKNLAVSHELTATNMGVYIQPMLQGVSCHCEFNLSYDVQNRVETENVRTFDVEAPRVITSMQGFFSRPYGAWTDVAWGNSSETVMAQRKIKAIFDPNDIMNPGKLCF